MRRPPACFGESCLSFSAIEVADAAQLLVPVGVLLLVGEDHLVHPGDLGPLRDEDDAVAARVRLPVGDEKLGEPVDVEGVLGDDAAVRGPRHRRQEGRETGVAPEHLDDEEALVAPGRGPERVGHLDRPRDAGREADAVVGPGDVVVHRLRDGDDLDPLLVEADAVRERVVAADRDQDVDPELPDVGEDLGSQVVHLFGVPVAEVRPGRSPSGRGRGASARCGGTSRRSVPPC